MSFIRPRLTDFYEISLSQEDVDFAIPFIDEDVPLFLDPFLLWKSPSLQDNSLHTAVVNSFNYLGYLVEKDREAEAQSILIKASECKEVGLGLARDKRGLRIGNKVASSITSLFRSIPQIKAGGFTHFEEIQLLVDHVSKDRVSDIACNFMKSFLIDFTIEQSEIHGIPLSKIPSIEVYDYRSNQYVTESAVYLPQNPETKEPILLVPKRWLRHIPWINFEDYYRNFYIQEVEAGDRESHRVGLLNFNRQNYDMVQNYVARRERTQEDCRNDPLFSPIPIHSAKRKFGAIQRLSSGKKDNADRKYEDLIVQLMASLMYPQLDFADEQSRTDSGVLIRDLVFYNNRSLDFLNDIHDDYGARQIVMELKNVKQVEREHINQLNRYLGQSFGKFGVLITRNRLSRAMYKNTIDLWAGQRKCIIALTDEDLSLMVSVFESKQRLPIEVLKKKYIEFMRSCPS